MKGFYPPFLILLVLYSSVHFWTRQDNTKQKTKTKDRTRPAIVHCSQDRTKQKQKTRPRQDKTKEKIRKKTSQRQHNTTQDLPWLTNWCARIINQRQCKRYHYDRRFSAFKTKIDEKSQAGTKTTPRRQKTRRPLSVLTQQGPRSVTIVQGD